MQFQYIDIRKRDSLSEQIVQRLKETDNTCKEALVLLAISKKIKDDSGELWRIFLELAGIYRSDRNDAIIYIAARISDTKAINLIEEFLEQQEEI